MKQILRLTILIAACSLNGGCVLVLAAGASAVIVDEWNESKDCDDNFDPLEDIRDKEDGCN